VIEVSLGSKMKRLSLVSTKNLNSQEVFAYKSGFRLNLIETIKIPRARSY
jgi:hypothetical protein